MYVSLLIIYSVQGQGENRHEQYYIHKKTEKTPTKDG